MAKNKPDLLPCPFCGGAAKIKRMEGSINYRYAICEKCGIRTGDIWHAKNAAKLWNARAYIELIRRDKPKKPKVPDYLVHCYAAKCKCGTTVIGKQNFCHECGQRLKWGE